MMLWTANLWRPTGKLMQFCAVAVANEGTFAIHSLGALVRYVQGNVCHLLVRLCGEEKVWCRQESVVFSRIHVILRFFSRFIDIISSFIAWAFLHRKCRSPKHWHLPIFLRHSNNQGWNQRAITQDSSRKNIPLMNTQSLRVIRRTNIAVASKRPQLTVSSWLYFSGLKARHAILYEWLFYNGLISARYMNLILISHAKCLFNWTTMMSTNRKQLNKAVS